MCQGLGPKRHYDISEIDRIFFVFVSCSFCDICIYVYICMIYVCIYIYIYTYNPGAVIFVLCVCFPAASATMMSMPP